MPNEDSNERYVRELLKSRFGAELRKLPETADKTPDYEVIVDGTRVAVLEVKTLKERWLSDVPGAVPNEDGFYVEDDKSPGRVGRVIHEAAKQFAAHVEPKILVILNDDHMDVHDLEEIVNGYLLYGTAETGYIKNVLWSKKDAHKLIEHDKVSIDLYVWINRFNGRCRWPVAGGPPREPGEVRFRVVTETGAETARQVFGQPMASASASSACRGGTCPPEAAHPQEGDEPARL